MGERGREAAIGKAARPASNRPGEASFRLTVREYRRGFFGGRLWQTTGATAGAIEQGGPYPIGSDGNAGPKWTLVPSPCADRAAKLLDPILEFRCSAPRIPNAVPAPPSEKGAASNSHTLSRYPSRIPIGWP